MYSTSLFTPIWSFSVRIECEVAIQGSVMYIAAIQGTLWVRARLPVPPPIWTLIHHHMHMNTWHTRLVSQGTVCFIFTDHNRIYAIPKIHDVNICVWEEGDPHKKFENQTLGSFRIPNTLLTLSSFLSGRDDGAQNNRERFYIILYVWSYSYFFTIEWMNTFIEPSNIQIDW